MGELGEYAGFLSSGSDGIRGFGGGITGGHGLIDSELELEKKAFSTPCGCGDNLYKDTNSHQDSVAVRSKRHGQQQSLHVSDFIESNVVIFLNNLRS